VAGFVVVVVVLRGTQAVVVVVAVSAVVVVVGPGVDDAVKTMPVCGCRTACCTVWPSRST
jgi:hypothetical protein